MMTITPKEHVVAEARSWVGTPFKHQGRAKGVGVDCVGLLIGVARRLGIVAPAFDVTGYTRRPDGWTLIEECERHMGRVDQAELASGDGVIVRFDAEPQHFGFVAPYRHGGWSIIHATAKYGCVVETRLLFGVAPMAMKFVAAYRLPGVL
jgi:cell wall-associated NlpC family hydrolase